MPESTTSFLVGRGPERWFAKLGVADAPRTRENLQAALAFFHRAMPTLPRESIADFLRAMDLSRPVTPVTELKIGRKLAAFRTPTESPFKLFYTDVGVAPTSLGVNDEGRRFQRFEVARSGPALRSYTTGTIDHWSTPASGQRIVVAPRHNTVGVMARGGGVQYIIPRSWWTLKVLVIEPVPRSAGSTV